MPFLAADQIVERHLAPVEHDLPGIDAAIAQLVELARRDALALLDQQQAHAAVARFGRRIGLDQHGEDIALDAVGDPGLGAVDDIGVALALGAGAHGLEIGAAVRLGQGDAAAQLAGREFRQEARLLLLGAEALDRRRHDQVRIDNAGDRHPPRRNPLDDRRIGHRRQAEPAIFRRDGGAEQAEVLHLLDDAVRVFVPGFQIVGDRQDAAFDEALYGVEDGAVAIRIAVGLGGGQGHCHGALRPPCRRRRSRAWARAWCAGRS